VITPDTWTPQRVSRRLFEAAGVSTGVSLSADARTLTEALTPDAVTKAQEAIGWLSWLPASDADIVWARAQGQRWKLICWQQRFSRPTAHRRRQHALRKIADELNGTQVCER
jgi:hypothetical protein